LSTWKFLASKGADIEYADAPGDNVVVISWPGERKECDASSLCCGGFMSCENAFKTAAHLGLSRGVFGEFLNLLEIKLRHCQLGCF
jgi:hypothetical protein